MTFGARLGLLRARDPVSRDDTPRPSAFARRLGPPAGCGSNGIAAADGDGSRMTLPPSNAIANPKFERRVFALREDWAPASPLPARLDGHAVPEACAIQHAVGIVGGTEGSGAVFLDLETTGLGSAGRTLAFIVGMTHAPAVGRLEIVQWTLTAPEGERSMLRDVVATLEGALASSPVLATFNGASFDVPLLLGRLARLGLRAPERLHRARHLDLLHVARRLGGSELPDRRLGTLEQRWLGIHRAGDLEGAEIATVFEQCVRDPDAPWVRARLDQARAHNRLDLIALTLLISTLAERLAAPSDAAAALRAARHFARCDRGDRVVACVRPFALRWFERGSLEPREDHHGVLAVAELLRRHGAIDDAARLWSWLCTQGLDDGSAHEALAKDLEHRRRCPEAALALVEASPAPCPRRLARLRRKVAARGAN